MISMTLAADTRRGLESLVLKEEIRSRGEERMGSFVGGFVMVLVSAFEFVWASRGFVRL